MSILDHLPHECTIRRRTRAKGTLGGSKDSYTTEQTKVKCWEQGVGHNEIRDYAQRGMTISRKVYFTSDPSVSSRHQILITKRNKVAVSTPMPLDVMSEAIPDASVGKGIVYKVMVERVTSSDN